MSNYQRHILTRWIFVIVTLSIVSISATQVTLPIISARLTELGVYSLLTAFAIVFSVPLTQGRLSIAHAIGAMAFLSLPVDVVPTMTIAIFIGGLLGSTIFIQLDDTRFGTSNDKKFAQVIYLTGAVTITFYLANVVYLQIFGGTLPIAGGGNITQDGVAIIAYAIIYAALHLMGYALYVDDTIGHVEAGSTEGMVTLLVIMLLPLPFVLIGADVAQRDESFLFFTITIVGTALTVSGLFVLTQAQQRWRQRVDEMRTIADMTRIMRRNTTLQALPHIVYQQVQTLIPTDHFTFCLINDMDNVTYPLAVIKNETIDSLVDPIDQPLIEHLLSTGQLLLVDDTSTSKIDHISITIPKAIQSWLGVPLLSGTDVIGALALVSTDGKRFDDNDLRLLTIIADSTSIAIENARLYQQQQLRAEQLATLNQITSLLTGTLSTHDVLDTIISSASTLASSDAVAIFLYDDSLSESDLSLSQSAGLSDNFINNPMMPLLVSNPPTKSDPLSVPTPLVLSDLSNDDRTQAKRSKQLLAQEGKHALLEVPLTLNQTQMGYICMYFNLPRRFTSESLDLVQAFAVQASQAIKNARTFTQTDQALEQRVEQLYALAAMGRLLNATLEVSQIYTIILNYAVDATKAARGAILMLEHGQVNICSEQGYPSETFTNPELLMQGLTGKVLSIGQPTRINDVRRATGYLPLVPQTRSLLIIPMMRGREILGAVLLESNVFGAFSEGDGHFVAQIANQAVIALENTQLFQRVRQALDNMTVMLDAMEEGIILINMQGQIAQANPRVNLIELNEDAILNQNIKGLLADKSMQLAKRLGFASNDNVLQLLHQLNNDHIWEAYPPHRYEVHSPEFGIRYIQRQIIPVRDEKQTLIGTLLVFYNKTEEFELAQAREAFSNMIVHDLRSPLTAVTTSMSLLDTIVPNDSEHYPLVQKTTNASNRAVRTVLARVDSLLDISKMESGEMTLEREPTMLHLLVASVFSQLEPLAQENNVMLKSQIPESLPLLDIDADKVERLILNLVDNALKYSETNQTVMVEATLHDAEKALIYVADTGPGIPDEYKKRLFDRFVQVEGRKTVRRGVGLGLTFCKLVTEAHEGHIWVEDNDPQGSIFKVTLPIATLESTSDE